MWTYSLGAPAELLAVVRLEVNTPVPATLYSSSDAMPPLTAYTYATWPKPSPPVFQAAISPTWGLLS